MNDKLTRARAAFRRELARDSGEDLRALRVEAGVQPAHLATALGVTRQRIAAIESSLPSAEVCARYRRALAELKALMEEVK